MLRFSLDSRLQVAPAQGFQEQDWHNVEVDVDAHPLLPPCNTKLIELAPLVGRLVRLVTHDDPWGQTA